MTFKRALTIGLLSIATIGLLGCAIVLGKKYKEYAPKTLETKADYYFDNYTNTTKYTIKGETNYTYADDYYYPSFEYTLKVDQGSKRTTINLKSIFIQDDWYNVSTQTNNTYNVFSMKEIKLLSIQPAGIVEWDEENFSKYVYRVYIQFKWNDDTWSTSHAQDINITTEDMSKNPNNDWIIEHTEVVDVQQNLQTLKHTYETGYTTGYQTKGDLADGNFYSLRETMLNVLVMPFTFINQAFNVTLWEGTPYAFNISSFIKGIIAIASILFIIKIFTSGFSIIGNYTGNIIERNDQHKLSRSQRKLNKAKTKQIKQNKPQIKHTYIHKDE